MKVKRAERRKGHRGVYCREMEDDFMVMHRSCSSSRLSIKRSCTAEEEVGRDGHWLVLEGALEL